PRAKAGGRRTFGYRIEYLFLLPGMLIFGMFILYPLFASQYFSLLRWSGFDAHKVFVKLDNYVELLSDTYFRDAFVRSLVFMAATVPAQMAVSLVFAIILNNRLLRLSSLFRTLIFLPVVTPVAV